MEQLSRRLHQLSLWPRAARGTPLCSRGTPEWREYRYSSAHYRSLDAAYIAGLVDGEGTITLSRRHAR